MTVDAYLDSDSQDIRGRILNFYQKYGAFIRMPENPQAQSGKIPKPKTNKVNDTAPLYYDLNRMKQALETDAAFMEEMRLAQKDLAENGSTALEIPDPDDVSEEDSIEHVA